MLGSLIEQKVEVRVRVGQTTPWRLAAGPDQPEVLATPGPHYK